MADGKVVFEIQGDPKGIKTTLKDVTNDIERESKKWDTAAGDAASGAEGAWSSAVGKIVGTLSAAGVASILMNWGRAAISAASDLAEVQNVVDVTFGEGASKIEAWSKTAGKQFGLTETQAKKFTSTLGAMMKSQGIADKEIVQMSTDLAGLAADMASFYNLDFEEAFNKIRSGISGETEPLKQLGINMSAANLEAFRLEKGITKAYTAMSQSEQTALRYEYIMRATADAQGDFARTADGFANASRRMETAMETIKTKGGELLLDVFEPLVGNLADFLSKLTEEPERTVLDDFADIDNDVSTKMSNLESTYNKAQDILNVIKDISKQTATLSNGSTTTLGELFESIAKIEADGGDIGKYISSLGLDVDSITQKYLEWKEAVSQLTSTVPALKSVIDQETGAIKGGTDALDENLRAWKENEEKKLKWAAYYAKARALEEKKALMYQYQLESDTAEQAKKRIQGEIQKLLPNPDEYNLDSLWTQPVEEIRRVLGGLLADEYWDNGQEYNKKIAERDKLLKEYSATVDSAAQANQNLAEQTEANAAAEQWVADAKQVLLDEYGEEEEAVEKVTNEYTNLGNAEEDAAEKAKTAAKEAVDALNAYVKQVRDATESEINSIIKGFDSISRPADEMRKKRSQLVEEQHKLNTATKKGKQQYDELQKQIDEINKSLNQYTTGGMRSGLDSQLAFMDEYMANLEKAQKMGLSNELLASLSDGSVESAEYLAALVNDPQAAREVDALFQQVQAKKKEFTDALTDQKLAADETYTGLVENAKQALSELNMQDTAKNAMLATVQGLADGIWAGFPDFKAAVDAIVGQMNRLAGPASGESDLTLDGSNAKGLDYVPFDGYLSELHEGEGILTAEENRIWQRFKNGGASSRNVDYDALGATMRDNVKAGGNVYLDGRVVGSVISAQQGNSYRSMQRSGFQG